MAPSDEPFGRIALKLCEGVLLLLIENGALKKDSAVEMIEGLIELTQNEAGESKNDKASLAIIRVLREITPSLMAARTRDTRFLNFD